MTWGRFFQVDYSGQISSRPHTTSPKWWWTVREMGPRLFQGNLGWWNIIIWPDYWGTLGINRHIVREWWLGVSFITSETHGIFWFRETILRRWARIPRRKKFVSHQFRISILKHISMQMADSNDVAMTFHLLHRMMLHISMSSWHFLRTCSLYVLFDVSWRHFMSSTGRWTQGRRWWNKVHQAVTSS